MPTISGQIKLPGAETPLTGTWWARIHSDVNATIDGDGTIRAGIEPATDVGEGAEMKLPAGLYDFMFVSDAKNPATKRTDTFGWYTFEVTAAATWGAVMTTPVVIPVTPQDVTLAEEAREAAEEAAAAAEVARDEAVAAKEAAEQVPATNDAITEALINQQGSKTEEALSAAIGADTTKVSRTARTKHAPALGLFFPEAEGALGAGATETAAVQAALTAAAGATLHIERGQTFVVDTLNPPSNVKITGGGTLKYKSSSTAFALLRITAVSNVIVDDILFDGNLGGNTFSEFRSGLIIGGSSNVTVRNCTFQNLIGDGIYITSDAGVTSSNLDIHHNDYLGSNANRNGISIISCSDSRIHHNFFSQMSRSDMPGAIDIEPNLSTEVVRNLTIDHNIFVGGSTADQQKAVVINNGQGGICTDVAIQGNTMRGAFRYVIAIFGNNSDKTRTQASVLGNVLHTSGGGSTESAGIILSAMVQAQVQGNWINATSDYGIKTVGATFNIAGNVVLNAGVQGFEIVGGANDAGAVKNNYAEECGDGIAGKGGIHIKASHLDILNNSVRGTSGTKTATGLYIEAGTENYVHGNRFKGMSVRSISASSAPQIWGTNYPDGASGANSITGTYPPTSGSWIPSLSIRRPTTSAAAAYEDICIAQPNSWVTLYLPSSTTTTFNFPSIAAGGSAELTVGVAGAAVNDTVRLGPPATIEAGLVWNGYVSAAGVVTVRVSNITAAAIDPASASWKVTSQR